MKSGIEGHQEAEELRMKFDEDPENYHRSRPDSAASHKEVKRILVGTGVSGHAGSDSFRDSLPIFKGMRICPT